MAEKEEARTVMAPDATAVLHRLLWLEDQVRRYGIPLRPYIPEVAKPIVSQLHFPSVFDNVQCASVNAESNQRCVLKTGHDGEHEVQEPDGCPND